MASMKQKRKANDLSLQMWRWLYKHPLKDKRDFLDAHPKYPRPESNACAWCSRDRGRTCEGCALYVRGEFCAGGHYGEWSDAKTKEYSQKHSGAIVKMLEDWQKTYGSHYSGLNPGACDAKQ